MNKDPSERPDYSERFLFDDDDVIIGDRDQSSNVSDGTKALLEEKCIRSVRNEDRLSHGIVTLFHRCNPYIRHLLEVGSAKQCQDH